MPLQAPGSSPEARTGGAPIGRDRLRLQDTPSHQRGAHTLKTIRYRLTIIRNVVTNTLDHLEGHSGAQRAPRCPRNKMVIYTACLIFLMLELCESSLYPNLRASFNPLPTRAP